VFSRNVGSSSAGGRPGGDPAANLRYGLWAARDKITARTK
jgi:hypothetical protein